MAAMFLFSFCQQVIITQSLGKPMLQCSEIYLVW